MKFLTEQKILYLKQMTLGRIFPLPTSVLIVSKMLFLIYIYIYTKKNQLKSITYRNIDLNIV